jgi:hypothetical protein
MSTTDDLFEFFKRVELLEKQFTILSELVNLKSQLETKSISLFEEIANKVETLDKVEEMTREVLEKSIRAQLVHGKALEVLIQDYIQRKAQAENRPVSEIKKEVDSLISGSSVAPVLKVV